MRLLTSIGIFASALVVSVIIFYDGVVPASAIQIPDDPTPGGVCRCMSCNCFMNEATVVEEVAVEENFIPEALMAFLSAKQTSALLVARVTDYATLSEERAAQSGSTSSGSSGGLGRTTTTSSSNSSNSSSASTRSSSASSPSSSASSGSVGRTTTSSSGSSAASNNSSSDSSSSSDDDDDDDEDDDDDDDNSRQSTSVRSGTSAVGGLGRTTTATQSTNSSSVRSGTSAVGHSASRATPVNRNTTSASSRSVSNSRLNNDDDDDDDKQSNTSSSVRSGTSAVGSVGRTTTATKSTNTSSSVQSGAKAAGSAGNKNSATGKSSERGTYQYSSSADTTVSDYIRAYLNESSGKKAGARYEVAETQLNLLPGVNTSSIYFSPAYFGGTSVPNNFTQSDITPTNTGIFSDRLPSEPKSTIRGGGGSSVRIYAGFPAAYNKATAVSLAQDSSKDSGAYYEYEEEDGSVGYVDSLGYSASDPLKK